MADIPGDSSTTSTIGLGGYVIDTLESAGDHDWFAITLTAGQEIVISAGGYGGSGSLEDSYVYLRDSTGALLASNDDMEPGHRDSLLTYTVTATGTYYVDVRRLERRLCR